ncbi:hypothetical protein [Yoonia sp. R2-816]|uniref:hypothetical protein n=1 Tax=Yoonia sp. R2-816 TaxID=3342638 RepID=UPI003726A27B
MKPKMSAAQLEARQKAGLSIANPTHACSGAISNTKKDCEEKRDPDERQRSQLRNENELDLNQPVRPEVRGFTQELARHTPAEERWM